MQMQENSPLILNIESATDICSVALSRGVQILAFKETEETFAHSKVLTLLIEDCLSAANIKLKDIDAVAISRGPGSYTSLRVGSSVAKGICYALNKPMIAVDTLKSLALATYAAEGDTEAIYAPMIDARRMEVYTAHFYSTGDRLMDTAAEVITEKSYSNIFKSEKKVIFCGSGAEKCRSVLLSPLAFFSPIVCSAMYLPPLAVQAFNEKRFEDIAYFEPEYFKAPNITKSKKRLL
jgi:tRNA threonylcarbamoyladenosine biosynthesis protein TsaB